MVRAVARAAAVLDSARETPYDRAIFVAYTRHIIEQMGGAGPTLDACAREIYDEWAACQHFELYADVPAALRALAVRGLRIGLISNSHRCLESFLHRSDRPHPRTAELAARGVPILRSLRELMNLLYPGGHFIERPPSRCRWM